MPAKRLPWIKFWPEAVDHEKFAALSDGEAWTWVVVWAKASQQATRWRFASVEHAAKVSGRPAKHIRRLIEARLMDERSDGVWMHNAPKWQDRYPSDEDRTPPPFEPEHSAKAPRKLRKDTPEACPEIQKGDTETERDGDTTPHGVGGTHSNGAVRGPLRVVEREPVPKPAKTPTLLAQLIDRVRCLDPSVELFGDAGRNGAKLKENADTLNLDLLADAIVARAHGEWTTPYLDDVGGAVWAFIGELGKYVAWKRDVQRVAVVAQRKAEMDIETLRPMERCDMCERHQRPTGHPANCPRRLDGTLEAWYAELQAEKVSA